MNAIQTLVLGAMLAVPRTALEAIVASTRTVAVPLSHGAGF